MCIESLPFAHVWTYIYRSVTDMDCLSNICDAIITITTTDFFDPIIPKPNRALAYFFHCNSLRAQFGTDGQKVCTSVPLAHA